MIDKNKITINISEEFLVKTQKKRASIYALVCSLSNAHETPKLIVIFKLLENMNDCFDSQEIFKLSEHNENDHAIDLMLDVKSSFEFLYALSKKKLTMLRDYLRDNFELNKIRHSISETRASIMFVIKKNDSFRLCVDYRELNALIIKNRHSLFFIDETLNRLIDVCYFTKLNLRDVYHRIRIRAENE